MISWSTKWHPLSRAALAFRCALSEVNCKWCAKCARVRHKDDFHKCASNPDGLQARCIECGRKMQVQYQQENRNRITETHRQWVKRNASAQREYGKSYRSRTEVRVRHRRRAATYRGTVAGNLKNRIASRIYAVLKSGKGGSRTEAIVGYSMDELRVHLERQFLRGMSWENMGEWHIDHIIPLASFTITGPDDPELRRAWSLPNLRPLWAAENIAKRDKRVTLL